jgi:hypothetical protein
MKKHGEFTQRKSETSSMKEAINTMLESYKIKNQFNINRLISSWQSMMGPPIAKRTEKIFVKEAVLFVKLNSPRFGRNSPLQNPKCWRSSTDISTRIS